MKTTIAIYGGTNLSSEIALLVSSITSNLLKSPEVVIMNGGFDHYTSYPGRKSVDKVVLETVRNCLTHAEITERFETWLPKENDRKKVVRFEEGRVFKISGSTQARRFNMIQNADAIVTIKGEGNTRSIIELALAINKPVLPIPLTLGDSKKMWDMYKDDINGMLKLSDEVMDDLQKIPATSGDMETLGVKIATIIKNAAQRKCLVLMPFGKTHDDFYDKFLKPAISNANYLEHRIDRNDLAGNIPLLFKTNLENAHAVIVDITELNPNVLYELGYAHAHNINPFIIMRKAPEINIKDLIPFYLKQEMVISAINNYEGYKDIGEAVAKFLTSQISNQDYLSRSPS